MKTKAKSKPTTDRLSKKQKRKDQVDELDEKRKEMEKTKVR